MLLYCASLFYIHTRAISCDRVLSQDFPDHCECSQAAESAAGESSGAMQQQQEEDDGFVVLDDVEIQVLHTSTATTACTTNTTSSGGVVGVEQAKRKRDITDALIHDATAEEVEGAPGGVGKKSREA